jgi:hypothetical protein
MVPQGLQLSCAVAARVTTIMAFTAERFRATNPKLVAHIVWR